MRNHESHIEMSRHQAVDALMQHCDFHPKTQFIPTWDAFGRVLARDLEARYDLPNKPTSSLDAIAVRFDDFAEGIPDTSTWKRGEQFEFCNTGIAMPDGFDTAIAIESVEVNEEDLSIRILDAPEWRGQCTNEVGTSTRAGDSLAQAGEVLTPTLLSLLTMGGYEEVPVVEKPVVAFIPTGNELVEVSESIPAGKNVNSNSIMVCGKIQQWGGEYLRFPIIKDNRELLLEALEEAAEKADIIVINAGSSKGSDDFTIEILEERGHVIAHETNQGPGRHCSFAVFEGKPVVGISGPPVGAEFTCDWFVKPLIDLYLGTSLLYPPIVYAHIACDMPFQPRPVNVVQRARLWRDERGELWTKPLEMTAPVLRDCNHAQGFLVVPTDSYGYREGEFVPIELRYPYSMWGI